MKRIIKCGTAFLLALVLCLCLLPTTAFAASKQVYIWNFPLSDDTPNFTKGENRPRNGGC